jgi:uncharacterized membrane protein
MPMASEDRSETDRLEAFSDGVFAIVITLLVLEIRVPRGQSGEGPLVAALVEQWPTYLAFLASFATVGIMWVNHHRLFVLIGRTDNNLFLLNLLLLLGVTIVPFPTAVLAEYIGHPGERAAAIVYTGTSVIIAILFNLLWRYAAANGRLLPAEIDRDAVRRITRSYAFGPALYLAAVATAFWNVKFSIAITIGLAIFFALPPERVVRGSSFGK